MPLPAITGQIRRRILLNFRLRPEVLQPLLPSPFRPILVDGWAIAGICLIRLEQLRPQGLPSLIGLSSENAAHRVAVAWTDSDGQEREGVYIFRRESNSRLNHAVGGRLIPGYHHPAKIKVSEEPNALRLTLHSHDGEADLVLAVERSANLPPSSLFRSVAEASDFFRRGADGYSPDHSTDRVQGIHLSIPDWTATPLHVTAVRSAFYQDGRRFPSGAVTYDSCLLMENLTHTWRSLPALPSCCTG